MLIVTDIIGESSDTQRICLAHEILDTVKKQYCSMDIIISPIALNEVTGFLKNTLKEF